MPLLVLSSLLKKRDERNLQAGREEVERFASRESRRMVGTDMLAGDSASFCLGPQAHRARTEDVLCRVCGNFVARAVILGAYRVHRLLGSGRSGNAYLATQVRSGQ